MDSYWPDESLLEFAGSYDDVEAVDIARGNSLPSDRFYNIKVDSAPSGKKIVTGCESRTYKKPKYEQGELF